MKKIVVNRNLPDNMLNKLKALFKYDIILCEDTIQFEEPVAAHPDMNYLYIRNKLFTIKDALEKTESKPCQKLKYPNDVLLNAFCVGDDFICKTDSVYSTSLSFAKDSGMRIINVNQGYVKCNLAVVDEVNKAIITEDVGISKVLLAYGYDVLLLNMHAVLLNPYDYGFIGGASGNIDGKLVFTGDVSLHPEFDRIKAFCAKYNTEILCLSDDTLYDYGSIILIEE